MSCLLACLYLAGGLAYMLPHGPANPPFQYLLFDVNDIENPYGSFELGWSAKLARSVAVEVAARHLSSLAVDTRYGFGEQWGQNTVELRLRWYPWASP